MMYSNPFVVGSIASCIVKIGCSFFSISHGFLGAHIHQRFVQSFHTGQNDLKCHSVSSPLDCLKLYLFQPCIYCGCLSRTSSQYSHLHHKETSLDQGHKENMPEY